MLTLIFKVAENKFIEWEGKITHEEDYICLTAFNMIEGKRIECHCKVGCLSSKDYPFYVDIDEKTACILGGCGCPCVNEKEVEETIDRLLPKWQFRRKEQISLFDFVWE